MRQVLTAYQSTSLLLVYLTSLSRVLVLELAERGTDQEEEKCDTESQHTIGQDE